MEGRAILSCTKYVHEADGQRQEQELRRSRRQAIHRARLDKRKETGVRVRVTVIEAVVKRTTALHACKYSSCTCSSYTEDPIYIRIRA